MNRIFAICLFFIIFESAHSQASYDSIIYTKLDNGNILASGGTGYAFFAREGIIETFGDHRFVGKIKREKSTLNHMGGSRMTGMYSCEKDPELNMLYRIEPYSEWASYYRKTFLPEIDLSLENCIRLEFIHYKEMKFFENNHSPDIKHMFCDEGIRDFGDIRKFLFDIKKQKTVTEAGLYELIKKPDGYLENCYLLGYIYGYFKDEPNLAVSLTIWSFNDIAYSIELDRRQYVFPEEWYSIIDVNR
ncbi:MAG: hypothetical protein LBK61_11650 [Spirochaetaceae bacterium]|jgi:hypothetical protein|nr:hypothetical protein [Spirochaetaceae bacterium]